MLSLQHLADLGAKPFAASQMGFENLADVHTRRNAKGFNTMSTGVPSAM